MNTTELLAALRRHYLAPNDPEPAGVFVHEIPPNGYWTTEHRCDAIFLGFTNASGRVMVGHELKTSRSDWQRELDNPRKADLWADQCHEFWLVVSDPAIVDATAELPTGWGLMSPPTGRNRRRMNIHVKTNHTPSWDATRSVLARAEKMRTAEVAAAHRTAKSAAVAEAHAEVQKQWDRRMESSRSLDADQLRARIARIETALGARIDWTAAEYRLDPDYISLKAITEISAAIRGYSTLQYALEEFTDRYRNPMKLLREHTEQLQDAITGLQQLAVTTTVASIESAS